mgnify:CR=1 FL=1
MANNIHKYSVQESNNLQLGQNGALFDNTGGTFHEGNFVAFQVVASASFTVLEVANARQIGTALDSDGDSQTISGNSMTGVSFPAGTVLFGNWVGFELSSGSVIAYYG